MCEDAPLRRNREPSRARTIKKRAGGSFGVMLYVPEAPAFLGLYQPEHSSRIAIHGTLWEQSRKCVLPQYVRNDFVAQLWLSHRHRMPNRIRHARCWQAFAGPFLHNPCKFNSTPGHKASLHTAPVAFVPHRRRNRAGAMMLRSIPNNMSSRLSDSLMPSSACFDAHYAPRSGSPRCP